MDSFPLRLHSPSPRWMPLMTVFLLSTDCGLLCVHMRGRVAVSGLCLRGYKNIRCADAGDTHGQEDGRSWHVLLLGSFKVTENTASSVFKLWSSVGKIHPPSGASVLLNWLYFPNSKEDWNRGGELGGRLRLIICYCFCILAHTAMMMIHNRLHITFLNFTLSCLIPGYFCLVLKIRYFVCSSFHPILPLMFMLPEREGVHPAWLTLAAPMLTCMNTSFLKCQQNSYQELHR